MADQEFSEWVHAMRRHQSPVSESSSWADTDSDSDSDNDDVFEYATAQSLRSNKKMAFERTAPMMIPECTRRRRTYYMNEFDESVPQKQHAGVYRDFYDSSDFAASVDDEDDPALYQNLAYFRSQNASKHSHKSRSRSSSPAPQSVSASSDSDDIFDMEL
uniref:Uncharacterized protein n=1 Tax=Globisporangium ultimum (strain ATCC 200006 / CBS 805.95 / DAOM BR144) TaxID=431595 RepID=K3WET8_GLOUD